MQSVAATPQVDMNRTFVGVGGVQFSSDNFAGRIVLGQVVAGSVSSADYNMQVGIYFDDETAPTVVITGPSSGSTTMPNVVFSFLGTDTDSSISKYWVNMDSGEWIDNGTTTTYTYVVPSTDIKPVTHIFYVKATNIFDLNSAIASQPITFQSGNTGASTPSGGSSIEPSEGPVTTEEILSIEKIFVPLGDPSIPILDQTEKDIGLREKRFGTGSELSLKRNFKVFALMGPNGEQGYKIKGQVNVINISGKTLKGVEIIESIGKEIVEKASMIRSDNAFEVIEEDPVIRFVIGDLLPDENYSIGYEFDRTVEQGPLTEEMFNGLPAPIALVQLQEGDLCMGIQCNDFNPCTRDYCVEGKCNYVPMNQGAKCGTDMICGEGVCISPPAVGKTSLPTIPATGLDYAAIIVLLGAVALGLVAQVTITKWRKKKSR